MPQEQADIRFSASTPELTQTCQQFGQVYSCPTFPVQQARIWTLEVATVGEQTTAILYAIDGDGKKCEQPLVNTICELVSDAGAWSHCQRCSTEEGEEQVYMQSATSSLTEEDISYTSKWRRSEHLGEGVLLRDTSIDHQVVLLLIVMVTC